MNRPLLHKFNKLLINAEEMIVATLLTISVLVVFLGVVHRELAQFDFFWNYLSMVHFSWTQELCVYLIIWMAFFGAAYGVRQGVHIGVDILINLVGRPMRRKILQIGLFVGAIFTFVIAVMGLRWVFFIKTTGQVSPDLMLPMWIVYLCVPLGSCLMSYRFLQGIWEVGSKNFDDE